MVGKTSTNVIMFRVIASPLNKLILAVTTAINAVNNDNRAKIRGRYKMFISNHKIKYEKPKNIQDNKNNVNPL